MLYPLTAPLKSGGYHLVISGYNGENDAQISAELLLRSAPTDGGSEQTLAHADGPPPPPGGIGKRTWIDSTFCVAAAGQAGDALIVRTHFLGGSTFFTAILTELDLP